MAKKSDPGPVKLRVLCRCLVDGQWHEPNTVLEVDAATATRLLEAGDGDSTPEAVAYALSLTGTG